MISDPCTLRDAIERELIERDFDQPRHGRLEGFLAAVVAAVPVLFLMLTLGGR